MLTHLTLFITAGVLSLLITPVVRSLASRWNIVDLPDARRLHTGRVPRLGGLAVLFAVFGALVSSRFFGFPETSDLLARDGHLAWLLAGTLAVVGVGILDDVWQIGPSLKLMGQVLAATLVLTGGGYQIRSITNPVSGDLINLGVFGSATTVFWIVGVTNAFNLIDGLDGLASGVGLIAAVTISLLAIAQGRPDAALIATPLAGALGGFLFYNSHPATIFLGDTGAFLIGYVLAAVSIQGLQKGPTVAVLAVPLIALGLPILETLITIQRRLTRSGATSVWRSDADHIHHRLVFAGMSQRRAVLLLYAVSAGLAGLACLAVFVGGPGSAVAVVVVAFAVYAWLRRLGYLSADRAHSGNLG
ncbi:MAG: undecaprenyl/decaprenyl-phosphate alpha-N-acetylglucosaminyl 1-phosphate transferase [Deltaproteobacteria bacterium]|nr:undecaprenyl/decaprenyl-phosphate alpha-N-acetylglucosaminyl 1-phosphate transferase [Deltaproteobacteria bacterium]